jgi:cadmium resistance protein CadD (predicted permease)
LSTGRQQWCGFLTSVVDHLEEHRTMNNANSAPTIVMYVATGVAVIGVIVVLFAGFTEPFNGTPAGFVGRMMGAVGIGLAGLSNLLRGRGRVAVLWTGVAVGMIGLIVAVLGRVR